MDRVKVVANALHEFIGNLADWSFGCAHRRTTFPITRRAAAGLTGQPSTHLETYIVCLECGRHFPYDWSAMRLTKKRFAWSSPPPVHVLAEEGRGSQ